MKNRPRIRADAADDRGDGRGKLLLWSLSGDGEMGSSSRIDRRIYFYSCVKLSLSRVREIFMQESSLSSEVLIGEPAINWEMIYV